MPIDKNVKILVVDDIENAALMLRSQLKKLGFSNVEVAYSGQEALEKINATKDYGLFLCDWNMDHVNGEQVLQQVRGDQQLKQARFIVVTGDPRAEIVSAAKQGGVNGFIVKPYNLATLQQRVEAMLG